MGGYLDVKVCVFQVQRTEPVPCANLREDLLQRDHPERPSHEGVIQASEIEDGPEAAILFGDEEVTAVKAWLAQSWRNHFYGSFFQQRHHLWAQNASVLALHRGGDHAAETRGSSSELEWITSFYYPHNPLWHSGDGLPGLGRVARGWINSSGRLHGGRALVRDGRGKLLSFWECLCFIFSTITADGCMGACTDPVATNTIPSAPGRKRGCQEVSHKRPFGGRSGRGGTRPFPLPVLQIRRTPEAQGPTLSWVGGPGARRGVASGWAWTPSRLLSPSRLRGGNGRCRFRGLLSRRSPGATLSSCWAGALGQEVSHSLWRLLCLCEALSESFHCRSKEAAGGNWSIKEGDPVRVLDLRQREPQVALEHYQAGHRPSYGFSGSLGGSQSQVRCASQLPESRRIRLRLIYGREELGLIDLENRHRVERRSRLSSWSVGASSERWSGPAWLGRVTGLRLPADGSGWAEMCSHWLIQLRHSLISLFFSAVNRSEGGWSGSTEAGRVRGAPRSRELVVNFREERRWSLLRGLTAPRQKPLIQTAARGLLWWRPLQTQLFNRFERTRKSSASIPALAALGAGKREGAGSVIEPDSSSASEAASDMLSSASSSSLPLNETRSLVLAEGCWSGWKKRTEKTSLCGESETRGIWAGVSSLSPGAEILCPAVFSSQVPGRKKTGGREGRGHSLKRKRSASAERRDWCSRSENNQSQRVRHLHGISPSRKHTRCDRHRRAGETCTSRSNGAALERRFALLETYVRIAGWRQRTGPELLRCWGA